jgi:hypothetical protein
MSAGTTRDAPPGDEKAALAGGDLETKQDIRDTIQQAEQLKWKHSLELAIDALIEAQSGDLGLIERNLVEAATEMLKVASEIRRRLRQ